ncbi:hypothetical protein AVEN_107913-1 [Araneus ventricosus]|uniref:Uncharacterized protein n=1 Tax=Araneus ventricosus TaxID=182803 RepID=A0A4Y2PRC2_ARAVE|nr:hypothetical protein AVEN_107913-1 [Araneus ventricosus]
MAKKGDQVILPEGTGNPRIDPDRREASSEQSWVAEDDCCSPGEETGNGRDDCEGKICLYLMFRIKLSNHSTLLWATSRSRVSVDGSVIASDVRLQSNLTPYHNN